MIWGLWNEDSYAFLGYDKAQILNGSQSTRKSSNRTKINQSTWRKMKELLHLFKLFFDKSVAEVSIHWSVDINRYIRDIETRTSKIDVRNNSESCTSIVSHYLRQFFNDSGKEFIWTYAFPCLKSVPLYWNSSGSFFKLNNPTTNDPSTSITSFYFWNAAKSYK